jgi:trk system potassium uptake protein TrkA
MSFIVLGAGEIGYHLAKELCAENRDVIVIESNPEKIAQLQETGEDISIIAGNGSNPEILKKAGIETAELLIAVTEKDEVNITACYIASQFSKNIKKIARVREIDTHVYGNLFTKAPAIIDSLFNPEELCAIKIANLLQFPGVADISHFFDGRALLLGTKIAAESHLKGKSMIEIGQDRNKYGMDILIANIIRGGEALIPSGPSLLAEGDFIYAITLEKEIQKVMGYFCGAQAAINAVTILGGSNIGYYLARMLEQKSFNIKLIERDAARANFLSENLANTLVLKGEIWDRAINENEGIYKSDVFVAVTHNQEENIIATLEAKSKGVKLGICVLTQRHIAPLVKKIGIDICIHPQQLAIGKMLEYIRKGKISSVVVLNQNDIEVIEAKAMENSQLVHKAVKDIKLPQSSLILAIARKDGIIEIPNGNSMISPDDQVIFISNKAGVEYIERLITA